MAVDFDRLVQKPCQDILAEPVTFAPPEGDAFDGRGIVSDGHLEVAGLTDVAVSSAAPMLSVRLAELAAEPEAGWGLTMRGTQYTVTDVRPDGEGGADLILAEAA